MKQNPITTILQGHALEMLPTLPPKSVHCGITSPPYWGLRDYGTAPVYFPEVRYHIFNFLPEIKIPACTCSLGLEETPEAFIGHMVAIFRELKTVLRDDATCWVNIADTYWGGKGKSGAAWDTLNNENSIKKGRAFSQYGDTRPQDRKHNSIKPKDLCGIPWMLVLALRADGWYLRSEIIWHKPNPMPESVTDRPTKAHEYVFLLSKINSGYFYDADAIRTKPVSKNIALAEDLRGKSWNDHKSDLTEGQRMTGGSTNKKAVPKAGVNKRTVWAIPTTDDQLLQWLINYHPELAEQYFIDCSNKTSVWTIPTKGFKEAHFATFPEKLITDCIKAGTSEHGVCAACGAPYVRISSKTLVPTIKASYNSKPDKRDTLQDGNDRGSNFMKDGVKPGYANAYLTTGWQAQCQCNAAIIPATVIDIFGGSGTTGIVSNKLFRNAILIELNPGYITINHAHDAAKLGLFSQAVNA